MNKLKRKIWKAKYFIRIVEKIGSLINLYKFTVNFDNSRSKTSQNNCVDVRIDDYGTPLDNLIAIRVRTMRADVRRKEM